MASADDQGITIEAFEEQLKMPQRCSLQALDALASDQCVAVDAHETVTEFIFEGLERLIQ
ncbi:hypothetical protein D3C72_2251990 [compost metagenome]